MRLMNITKSYSFETIARGWCEELSNETLEWEVVEDEDAVQFYLLRNGTRFWRGGFRDREWWLWIAKTFHDSYKDRRVGDEMKSLAHGYYLALGLCKEIDKELEHGD